MLRLTRATGGSAFLYVSPCPLVHSNLILQILQILNYNQHDDDVPDRPLYSEFACSSRTSFSHTIPFTNHLYRLGAVMAILTSFIWAVSVWTFTAPPNSPAAHRGLWSTFAIFVFILWCGFGMPCPAGGFRAISATRAGAGSTPARRS